MQVHIPQLIPTGNRFRPREKKVESVGKKLRTNLLWRVIYFCQELININSNKKKVTLIQPILLCPILTGYCILILN